MDQYSQPQWVHKSHDKPTSKLQIQPPYPKGLPMKSSLTALCITAGMFCSGLAFAATPATFSAQNAAGTTAFKAAGPATKPAKKQVKKHAAKKAVKKTAAAK